MSDSTRPPEGNVPNDSYGRKVADDLQIGRNVLTFRKAMNMSQEELGARMRAAGWNWSQTTVWNVETGRRSLKLAEAVDLADQFGYNADDLLKQINGASEAIKRYKRAAAGMAAALLNVQAAEKELSDADRGVCAYAEEEVPDYLREDFRRIVDGKWDS